MHTHTSAKFNTGYMDNAVFDLANVLYEAEQILGPVSDEFDTLVGTGFSGGMLIPMLALKLGKKFVLIRKETDDSHHGQGRLLGELGEKWIFVDDFCSSGRTRRRVMDKIATAAREENHRTEMVGNYYYSTHIAENYTRTDQISEARDMMRRELEERRYQQENSLWIEYPRPIRPRRATPWRGLTVVPDIASNASLDALRRKLTGEEEKPKYITFATGRVYKGGKLAPPRVARSRVEEPCNYDEEPMAEWEKALLDGSDFGPSTSFATYDETPKENAFMTGVFSQKMMEELLGIPRTGPEPTQKERLAKLIEARLATPSFSKFTKQDFTLRG